VLRKSALVRLLKLQFIGKRNRIELVEIVQSTCNTKYYSLLLGSKRNLFGISNDEKHGFGRDDTVLQKRTIRIEEKNRTTNGFCYTRRRYTVIEERLQYSTFHSASHYGVWLIGYQ
jgi:hypothetical protein